MIVMLKYGEEAPFYPGGCAGEKTHFSPGTPCMLSNTN